MTTLVTGGTGFVGAHIVRALLARGDRVRCLVRGAGNTGDSPGLGRDNLRGLDVEVATGDLRDPASLHRAANGCKVVYHCAADYRLFARRPSDLYETNVLGTRSLLAACAHSGVERIVYTSSVGALGLEADGLPATEETAVSLADMVGHYKRSKFLAECVVRGAVEAGQDIVLLHPTTPIGEFDVKPTPTGQIVSDFLAGRMPAYVDTGLNFVDVRDVAAGHLLAEERGQTGRRYILGHENLSLREFLDLLAEVSDRPRVRLRLPKWLPIAVAAIDTSWARVAKRTPRVSLESALMARKTMFFDSSRAVEELGFAQTPLREAALRAVRYFQESRDAQALESST